MLRLAVARSTRRYAPVTVKCSRFESTAPITGVTATPAGSSSSEVKANRPVAKKPSATKLVKKKQDVPLESPPIDFKKLGLKYDPNTLPLQQVLDPNIKPFTEEDYAMTLIHGRSVHQPYFHPRTHDIPMANIHFRSHHIDLLNVFTHFVTHAASSLGIPTSKVVSLPTQRRLWTVLRSPFAHKKSQENFERKVHKRAIKAWDADPEVVQRWVTYLRTHAMPGVGMKVITWDRMPIGIGASALKSEAGGMTSPSLTAPKKIKELGKKIVAEEGSVLVPQSA
ncbi:ribosomal protein S10 domain-containing protein [Flammula alnicola]|nr:ribosomal protein S10 domain-containing protein [Flammula alnicola]KAF8970984.1 ribosomal protein S10 domain-containing protein [Flammula alnicola]